jgi:DNA ligase-1
MKEEVKMKIKPRNGDSMVVFNRPMLACSLLKPKDKHDDLTILKRMQEAYRDIPGARVATFKEDGIRGVVLGDLASRSMKKIPNLELQARSKNKPYGLDCELANRELDYNIVQSIVMDAIDPRSVEIKFHIIDMWDGGKGVPYVERLEIAKFLCRDLPDVIPAEPVVCPTAESLFLYFKEVEQEKGEGICWRLPDSKYVQKDTKDNRSTWNEQYLLKLCRFMRAEATVIGFIEEMLNTNAPAPDFLGRMKRPTYKDGMVGKHTLGALLVRNQAGLVFPVSGFTDKLAAEIWDNQEAWLNTTIVYKSKTHGVKVKPRSPIYVGKRNEIDL